MEIGTVSYTQAKKRHPQAVKALMAKLAKGNSKEKGAKPSDLKWSYETCEAIGMTGGKKGLMGILQAGPRKPPTAAERLANTTTTLVGKIGRWWSREPLGGNPPEVKTLLDKQEADDKVEQALIDAMTPEERQADLDRLVGELSGMGGFIGISIPIKEPK